MSGRIIVPRTREVAVRQEGERVLLISEGRAVLDLPWQAARTLSRAIAAKAADAEELSKASSVALDAAILLRSGAPLGITSHPKIQEEAAKAAVSDRRLRRYMPGGIRSTRRLGRPAVETLPKGV